MLEPRSAWRSGPAALDEARVQADVPDVVSVQQPGEEAFQAQAVAAVGTRAVLPLQNGGKNGVKTGSVRNANQATGKRPISTLPDPCTSSTESGRFPPSCIPPEAPQSPRYASSLRRSPRRSASTRPPGGRGMNHVCFRSDIKNRDYGSFRTFSIFSI